MASAGSIKLKGAPAPNVTMTVKVNTTRWWNFRLQFGIWLIKCGARVMGAKHEVEERNLSWDELPKPTPGPFKPWLRIDVGDDHVKTVEAWFTDAESCNDAVHPNLMLYRSIETQEVVGCRLRMRAP